MLISEKETVVFKSISPKDVFCYTPSIVVTQTGKFIVTMDLGGDGVNALHGAKFSRANGTKFGQGKILESVDKGKTWQFVKNFPFWHARVFTIDNVIYVMGHAGDICIIKSVDDGKTWSNVSCLTTDEKWHSSACNVLFSKGNIYLAMEKRFYIDEIEGWNVAGLSPILFRASLKDDLCDANSWNRSKPIIYRDVVEKDKLGYLGVPFYKCNEFSPEKITAERTNAPLGWLETNVVQLNDEKHIWNDANRKTFHLFLRSHTSGTGYANMIKIIERDNGEMIPELEKAPSGKELLYIPFPGGHLKFYMLFDELSGQYWLLSNQATDSTLKSDFLHKTKRFGLPNNERHRLQLHFSKNCVDWCFAGMITNPEDELFSRNYPSAAIVGNDMHIVCRSADEDTTDPQYSDLITYHKIANFRDLIY